MSAKNVRGFTLVELLFTAAILGFSLSAVLATFLNASALNEVSRNLSIAVTHAEYILEDIRNTSFNNIATNINAGNWNWDAATVTSKGLSPLKSETTSVTVSGAQLLDVTAVVSWVDTTGRVRSKSLRTLISS